MILLLGLLGLTLGQKEPYWTKEQRFAKLMKITVGGKKVADIGMQDVQQLVMDGIGDGQKTDWVTIVMFNGLSPQFNCFLCTRAHNWYHLMAANSIQGEGQKKVFFLHIDYKQETSKAFQAMQFNMVPGWFIFTENGGTPELGEGITAQKFNERFPAYNAQAPTTDYEETQMIKLMFKWFQEHAMALGQKEIKMNTVVFSTPIRKDKVMFFGGLSLCGLVLVVFYHKYLFTRYAVGLLVMLFVSLCKSGLARSIIKNDAMGSYDVAYSGRAMKWDAFITVGVEMMFALSLIGLNSKGPNLIKNPICLLGAFAAYCAYFIIFKQIKSNYEFSFYHNYLEQYTV